MTRRDGGYQNDSRHLLTECEHYFFKLRFLFAICHAPRKSNEQQNDDALDRKASEQITIHSSIPARRSASAPRCSIALHEFRSEPGKRAPQVIRDKNLPVAIRPGPDAN